MTYYSAGHLLIKEGNNISINPSASTIIAICSDMCSIFPCNIEEIETRLIPDVSETTIHTKDLRLNFYKKLYRNVSLEELWLEYGNLIIKSSAEAKMAWKKFLGQPYWWIVQLAVREDWAQEIISAAARRDVTILTVMAEELQKRNLVNLEKEDVIGHDVTSFDEGSVRSFRYFNSGIIDDYLYPQLKINDLCLLNTYEFASDFAHLCTSIKDTELHGYDFYPITLIRKKYDQH